MEMVPQLEDYDSQLQLFSEPSWLLLTSDQTV